MRCSVKWPIGHACPNLRVRDQFMKRHIYGLLLLVAIGLLFFGWWPDAQSQQNSDSNAVQVHLVITDEAVSEDKELPPLKLEDVKVKQGKTSLKVRQLIPA